MPALEPARRPAALATSSSTEPSHGGPAVGDGLRRWRELLPALAAQRELLQDAGGQAPFRKPGHLEATHGTPRDRVRRALAAASSSLTWAQPALVPVRDPSERARGR